MTASSSGSLRIRPASTDQDFERAGYSRMRLDTMPSMDAAKRLYRSYGFRQIPPYTHNPVAGATFWELDLFRAC